MAKKHKNLENIFLMKVFISTIVYQIIILQSHQKIIKHSPLLQQEIEKHARKNHPSIRADGRRKVLSGTTTLEEVLRVTQKD